MTPQEIVTFANAVLGDWDDAMDKFFRAVEKARQRANLSVREVATVLRDGYGDTTANEWLDWSEETV